MLKPNLIRFVPYKGRKPVLSETELESFLIRNKYFRVTEKIDGKLCIVYNKDRTQGYWYEDLSQVHTIRYFDNIKRVYISHFIIANNRVYEYKLGVPDNGNYPYTPTPMCRFNTGVGLITDYINDKGDFVGKYEMNLLIYAAKKMKKDFSMKSLISSEKGEGFVIEGFDENMIKDRIGLKFSKFDFMELGEHYSRKGRK